MMLVIIGIVALLSPCVLGICWALASPEIGQPEDIQANDSARIAVILAACVQPTNRVRAGV